ncbi:hypothetical protein ONZ51_g6604 [Trametes cubensis]|uniref:Transposase n=1 Tax=Trametes cubensis TaxID=1111947 RepID=A0AAD7TRQ6_9APHY|nr:hypothetical protein ONZ51_g6604 [Trametes cubensis]
MPPALPDSTVNDIIHLSNQKLSISLIHAKTGVSRSQISKIRSANCPGVQKSKGGRPPLLSPTHVRRATRLVETGQADTATQVHAALKDTFLGCVSVQTIRRALKVSGMRAVTKKKRPQLTKRHRDKRYAFALSKKDWTVEDWKRVVWSDETKINRIGSDGRKWVWKKKGEGLSDQMVEGTLKFGGGSLMVWGCFGWKGTGHSCKITGKMDADLYVEIIEDELRHSFFHWDYNTDDIIFQQDNDPKHTSKKATRCFKENKINVMEWPPQSPDLNPIEHLWGVLKRKLATYPKPPTSMQELWERVQVEWEAISVEECQKLVESMPNRIAAVLKAKGGYTKY